jgi:hypothetical protein
MTNPWLYARYSGSVHRGENVAIGLTGLPDVPAKRTGATARWKSHWLEELPQEITASGNQVTAPAAVRYG